MKKKKPKVIRSISAPRLHRSYYSFCLVSGYLFFPVVGWILFSYIGILVGIFLARFIDIKTPRWVYDVDFDQLTVIVNRLKEVAVTGTKLVILWDSLKIEVVKSKIGDNWEQFTAIIGEKYIDDDFHDFIYNNKFSVFPINDRNHYMLMIVNDSQDPEDIKVSVIETLKILIKYKKLKLEDARIRGQFVRGILFSPIV